MSKCCTLATSPPPQMARGCCSSQLLRGSLGRIQQLAHLACPGPFLWTRSSDQKHAEENMHPVPKRPRQSGKEGETEPPPPVGTRSREGGPLQLPPSALSALLRVKTVHKAEKEKVPKLYF